MPYVGGYLDGGQTIDTLGPKIRRRLSGEDHNWGSRFIYPLPTSDSREASYAKLGSNNCWIKMAAPTAEAIRQAFLGHRSRISILSPNVSSLRIKSISINGSLIVADGEQTVSPELNSFIGGRGSGKSTLLEYMAFGLGRSCADIDKPDYSGRDRLKGLIRDTLTDVGGSLDIAIEQDGATFYVRRSGSTSYVPKITYPDGASQEIPVRELRSLFPAVVYSQGELSEIGKQAGKRAQLSELLQFVQPEFKREDERLNEAIEDGKLIVHKAVHALSAAWSQQANIQKLQTAKSSLEQRLTALQKTLPQLPRSDQQVIARYDALVDLDAKRQQAERQMHSVMNDLSELRRASRQPVNVTSQLSDAADLQAAYAAFTMSFATGIETLGEALARHRDKVVSHGVAISEALANAKLFRDSALNKLTAHKSVTAQITKLQEELQVLIAQIADLQGSLLSPDDKFADLQMAIKALHEAVILRGTKTQEWASKIEALSNQRIKAQLNVDGNWSEIFDAVDILAAKTGSQEAARHQRVGEKLSKDGAWQLLDALRTDCLAALRWKQVSQSSSVDSPFCLALAEIIGGTERTLTNCLELIDLQRVESIASAVPKPDITLYYCDGDRKISFEKASEGQRAAALLFMLLEQPGGPLIIDQPEGDLDNKIVSELADKLHSAKQHRQIMFASHNANIVVNGSSELVACMDVTSDAKRDVACAGAIDQPDVCLKITETMEGGEKAFRDRKDKYGY
jgi:type III restriction enzyme